MKKFRLVFFLALLVFSSPSTANNGEIEEERMCADEQCSVAISQAKTLVRYLSPSQNRISFEKGAIVNVLGKAKNSWLIKHANQEGYAPASFLREEKIFVKGDNLIKVTPGSKDDKLNFAQGDANQLDEVELPASSLLSFPSVVAADAAQVEDGSKIPPSSPQFEVFDGTTLVVEPIATMSETHPSVVPAKETETGYVENNKKSNDEMQSEEPSPPSEQLMTSDEYSAEKSHTSDKQGHSIEGILESTSETEQDTLSGAHPPSHSVESTAQVENQIETLSEGELHTSGAAEVQAEASPLSEDVKVEPSGSDPEPTASSPEPTASDPEPTASNPEPTASNPEPTASDPEPTASNPEPTASDLEPTASGEEAQNHAQDSGILSNFWNSYISGDGTEETSEENEEEEGEEEEDIEDEEGSNSSNLNVAEDSKAPAEMGSGTGSSESLTVSTPSVSSEVPTPSPFSASQDITSDVTPRPNDVTPPPPQSFSDIFSSPLPEVPSIISPPPIPDDSPITPIPTLDITSEPIFQFGETEDKIRVPRQVEPSAAEQFGSLYASNFSHEDQSAKSSEIHILEADPVSKQEVQPLSQGSQENVMDTPIFQKSEGNNQGSIKVEASKEMENQEMVQTHKNEELTINVQPPQPLDSSTPEAEVYHPEPQQAPQQDALISEQPAKISDQSVEPADQFPQDQDQPVEPSEQQVAGSMLSWFSGLLGDDHLTEEKTEEPVAAETQIVEPEPSIHPPPAPSPPPYYHEHPPAWGAVEQSTCAISSECSNEKESATDNVTEDSTFGLNISPDALLLRFVVTAFTLLLGVLAVYFVQKKQVDSVLIARINELEKQLLVSTKEALMLGEEAARVDSKELDLLREELDSSRIARIDLEEQVATLERELEEATETGIELNHLLAQTLEASKGKAHAGLMASVERLQQQLDSQREKVDSLTRSLACTSSENDSLKATILEGQERVAALEAELAAATEVACNLRREREEVELDAAQKLTDVQTRLEDALSSKVLQETRLATELSALKLSHEKLRVSLATRDAEVQALQDTVKDLESGVDRAEQLLDVAKLRAELQQVKQDRDECRDKLAEEEEARKRLENHAKLVEEDTARLRGSLEEAQRERQEAETRLTVLSNYFKDKEAQLLKELSLQEAIVAQHRGDESSVVKHLQSLQEEVETYRAQNESLKMEILDQERDFKGQIATLEKKSHDNWMAARQAERRLEEARQESAQLRNRLTLVEKNNAEQTNRMETNGEGGIASPVMMVPLPPPLGDMETPPPIPPFMFSPPPYPPPFLPPPPHPHSMGRPPPLGRMSSPPPPPIGQFSPPPHYDRLDRSSRSPSPPPHRYHHRSPPPPPPQQWDESRASFRPVPKPSPKKPVEQRDHRGSTLSSGHSNESLEKSRHSDHSREHV